MPNPDPSGSSDTRPRNERLRSHREIADRDFLLHDFLTIENSDFPIYASTGSSDTRPRTMDGPDLIGESRIAISICMSLLFPETPISRSPTFVRSLTPVPCERTAQILSVNRGSRFRVARVLCIRNPRYAELRLSGILCHVSLLLDGSDQLGDSRIATSYYKGSTLLNSPMDEIPTTPQNADTCPAEING
jgi:hypothetical protein